MNDYLMTSDRLPNKRRTTTLIRLLTLVLFLIAGILFWRLINKQAVTEAVPQVPTRVVVRENVQTEDFQGLAVVGVRPADRQDIMGWLGVRGFGIKLRASGEQSAFGIRFVIYRKGELIQTSPWHYDRTEEAQGLEQEIHVLFQIHEGEIEIWRRFRNTAGKVSLPFSEEGTTFTVFPQVPRLINGYQIPLAIALAPEVNTLSEKDFDPTHSYLILVMEVAERTKENPLP